MASVNPLTKEILLKVVYYGPGLGGKTTTLQYIHRTAKPEHRGKMVSLATPVDRTLYFDFLPVRLPQIGQYTLRLQLFTVPGQVHYNATRKLVLTGADGCVFVADSQMSRMDANIESLENLKENLAEQKIDFDSHPLTFQYNKRDLEHIATVEELERDLNYQDRSSIGTCALTGEGVYQGLETITKQVLKDLKSREILIHDERSTADRIENKIAFRTEERGILSSVRDFSESSSENIAPTDPSEKTATYSASMLPIPDSSGGDSEPPPTEDDAIADPVAGVPPGRRSTSPTPAITAEQTEPSVNFDIEEFEQSSKVWPITFDTLWPESTRDRVRAIERSISDERNREAICDIWEEIGRLLAVAKEGLPNSSDDSVVSLLGLSGREYLAVARFVRRALQHGDIPREALLRSYVFLLQTVTVVRPNE